MGGGWGYNLDDNAFLLYQSTNRWNLQSSIIARDDEYSCIFLRDSRLAVKVTSITDSCLAKYRNDLVL